MSLYDVAINTCQSLGRGDVSGALAAVRGGRATALEAATAALHNLAAATTRGDGMVEKKFPPDMFLLLRAFVKQREEEAVVGAIHLILYWSSSCNQPLFRPPIYQVNCINKALNPYRL